LPIDVESSLAELRSTRAVAIRELRAGFEWRGLDVSAYADNEVSWAILAAATAETQSSHELFARAFERLISSHAAIA
jgi:hypothetical protein